MSSLHEFYYEELLSKRECYQAHNVFEERFSCLLELIEIFAENKHCFTHFNACLIAKHFLAKSRPKGDLKTIEQIQEVAMSSGHKRIFQNLLASRACVS